MRRIDPKCAASPLRTQRSAGYKRPTSIVVVEAIPKNAVGQDRQGTVARRASHWHPTMTDNEFDYDWLVIGSGFGGSVSALRLAEKGYRVGVLERGRRYEPVDLPSSAWQSGKYLWAPRLGKLGIMRTSRFRHVFFPSQSGVGGGSLVYGGVLYRGEAGVLPQVSQWAGTRRLERLLLQATLRHRRADARRGHRALRLATARRWIR